MALAGSKASSANRRLQPALLLLAREGRIAADPTPADAPARQLPRCPNPSPRPRWRHCCRARRGHAPGLRDRARCWLLYAFGLRVSYRAAHRQRQPLRKAAGITGKGAKERPCAPLGQHARDWRCYLVPPAILQGQSSPPSSPRGAGDGECSGSWSSATPCRPASPRCCRHTAAARLATHLLNHGGDLQAVNFAASATQTRSTTPDLHPHRHERNGRAKLFAPSRAETRRVVSRAYRLFQWF